MTRTVLSLILASTCGCPSPDAWTVDRSLQATLQLVDRDGDGEVTGEEYEATRYYGPAFEEIDADADQRLTIIELRQLLAFQDPLEFDREGLPQKQSWDGPTPDEEPLQRRMLLELLLFLRAELQAADPSLTLPTVAELSQLALQAEGNDDELRSTLAQLRSEHERLGLSFPEGLGAMP